MVDPLRVIPEVGVGGFTNLSIGDVSIWLDVRNLDRMVEAIKVWLPEALAHELHHQRRVASKAGGWATLGDALVTEGLATTFAREAFPHRLSSLGRVRWLPIKSALSGRWQGPVHQPNRQHERWFFGSGDLPRWAGYTVGVSIVTAYLRTHPGQSASSLVGESAIRIILESGYDP